MIAHSVTSIAARVSIKASPQDVFNAATNWDIQHEWMVGTTVRATHLQGHDLSGRIEAFTGIGKVGFVDSMTITAWEPPHKCSVLHTGKYIRGTGVFEVIDLGDGSSQFVWAEQLQLPLGIVGRIAWAVARPFALYGLQLSLKRFGRWVESQPATV